MIRMASASHIRLVTAGDMKAHAAADIFPMMSDTEFDALVADIKENGQREPIVLHDGQILDGRNRARACEQLGLVPRTVQWDRKGTPEAFVVSMNLHRRHLNESQRGMIAAKLTNVRPGEIGGGHEKAEGQICLSDAAELLNVSKRTIKYAKNVMNGGTPEEIRAVEAGSASASTIAQQINAGQPPRERKAKRETPLAQVGNNPERIQRRQMHADIWAKLGGALDALTALPLPADVAEIINANTMRRKAVDEKLTRSLQWLSEFQNACIRD